MNYTFKINVKTFLLIIAIVAIAGWVVGCSGESDPLVKQGPYKGQNPIEVLEDKGILGVDTSDLQVACGYVAKLGRDGSIDDDDLLALGEKISDDLGVTFSMRNAEDMGSVVGIAVVTYCPEYVDMFKEGRGI